MLQTAAMITPLITVVLTFMDIIQRTASRYRYTVMSDSTLKGMNILHVSLVEVGVTIALVIYMVHT